MGIVIASLLMVAVLLVGFLLISQGMMNALISTTQSGKEIGKMISERTLTSIDVATAAFIAGNGWSEVMVLNDGHTDIGDFNKWDVFIQYHDTNPNNYMHYKWIPYNATYPPGSDQWAENGIYLDSKATIPEQYEPGILNHGEYLKLTIKVSSTIATGTWVYIKASTPNGVTDSIQYLR